MQISPTDPCHDLFLDEDLSHSLVSSTTQSSKVLPPTSPAENESWTEFCDHISAAPDSNFVAGTPISYHTVENVIAVVIVVKLSYLSLRGVGWPRVAVISR